MKRSPRLRCKFEGFSQHLEHLRSCTNLPVLVLIEQQQALAGRQLSSLITFAKASCPTLSVLCCRDYHVLHLQAQDSRISPLTAALAAQWLLSDAMKLCSEFKSDNS